MVELLKEAQENEDEEEEVEEEDAPLDGGLEEEVTVDNRKEVTTTSPIKDTTSPINLTSPIPRKKRVSSPSKGCHWEQVEARHKIHKFSFVGQQASIYDYPVWQVGPWQYRWGTVLTEPFFSWVGKEVEALIHGKVGVELDVSCFCASFGGLGGLREVSQWMGGWGRGQQCP
jgi:hypothetical protein